MLLTPTFIPADPFKMEIGSSTSMPPEAPKLIGIAADHGGYDLKRDPN